jgi:hypothetical protein
MGTMIADDDPGLTYIAGMAPDAQWIACKGCESYSCSDYALNTCADWILAPDDNPDNRPHIVNNSWGGWGGDSWYLGKVNAWRAAGIFPAFSAGNNYSCNSLGSPGDYQESFASASHMSNRNISSFSSKGPSYFGHEPYTKPNISAPGDYICSTVPTNGWDCSYSGTSMASPHSAGAVALLWSCDPSLIGQIDATFELLQDTADTPPAGSCGAPPDGEGNYTFGYGYLNVLAAGNEVCGGGPTDTLHVDGIRMRYVDRGGRYVVLASIRIFDQDNLPVEMATVDVDWTFPDMSVESQSADTDFRGLTRFRARSLQTGIHEVCVTDITKTGYIYDPSQNNQTCETVDIP